MVDRESSPLVPTATKRVVEDRVDQRLADRILEAAVMLRDWVDTIRVERRRSRV